MSRNFRTLHNVLSNNSAIGMN